VRTGCTYTANSDASPADSACSYCHGREHDGWPTSNPKRYCHDARVWSAGRRPAFDHADGRLTRISRGFRSGHADGIAHDGDAYTHGIGVSDAAHSGGRNFYANADDGVRLIAHGRQHESADSDSVAQPGPTSHADARGGLSIGNADVARWLSGPANSSAVPALSISGRSLIGRK
jgi:hypothetical protein